MRLQLKSPKVTPSVKRHALVYPLLLLVIIPFALALFLPVFFPYFQAVNILSLDAFGLHRWTDDQTRILVSILVVSMPSGYFCGYFVQYGGLIPRRYRDAKEGRVSGGNYSRIEVNLYEVLNRILIAEIAVLIVISITFYSIPESQTWPLFGKGFSLLQATFIASIYSILFCIVMSYMLRDDDFRFIMAKKSIGLANEEADQDGKINYLIAGLSWYNKYLKRNFDLQFDEKRVASTIITSSDDKNKIVKKIAESFPIDYDYMPKAASTQPAKPVDKLKPAKCLSTFANLEPKEQFLINKQLSTKIKEIGLFLAAIIPVIIAVIQFAFPQ